MLARSFLHFSQASRAVQAIPRLRNPFSRFTSMSCGGDIEDLNATCGFGRPREGCQLGSVDLYKRHFFLGTGHSDWAKKFPEGETDAVSKTTSKFKSLAKDLPYKTKFTATNAKTFTGQECETSTEVLVFPDQVVYHIANDNAETDVEAMVKHIEGDAAQKVRTTEVAKDRHFVFVCAHAAKDDRCGYCGPKLVDSFEEHLESKSLSERVSVYKVTHVGGHKYAGNVITFPSGEWYGYVTPELVPSVVNAGILDVEANGEPTVLKAIWRGRLGLSKDQVKEKAI